MKDDLYLFESNHGLTKLEYFTAMAMQGLIIQGKFSPADRNKLASVAIDFALETLEELEEINEEHEFEQTL